MHHVPLLPADSSCRREPESSLRSGFELPTARKALPGSFAQEREACAAERRTALPRLARHYILRTIKWCTIIYSII